MLNKFQIFEQKQIENLIKISLDEDIKKNRVDLTNQCLFYNKNLREKKK